MSEYALDRTCDKYGCAKLALDPKLHLFDDCFGGKIRMGDVDGSVEHMGHILWMEWKIAIDIDAFEKKHKAQIIQARAFTKNSTKQQFWFVVGNASKMEVEMIRCMSNGEWNRDWQKCDLAGLKRFLSVWFARTNGIEVAA